jgi:hypothetical protein
VTAKAWTPDKTHVETEPRRPTKTPEGIDWLGKMVDAPPSPETSRPVEFRFGQNQQCLALARCLLSMAVNHPADPDLPSRRCAFFAKQKMPAIKI